MRTPIALTKKTALVIAQELKVKFLDEGLFPNQISIFLCGGASSNEDTLRKIIRAELVTIGSKSPYSYTIYFPEYLFYDLIHGHARKDLISLEGLLASSVDIVVILVHSAGTIAELGAFTSHVKLLKKLLVVIEPKYKTKQSFINLGPLRLLQPSYRHILYQEMTAPNAKHIAGKIAELAREIVKNNEPSARPKRELDNPIAAHQFYLALIYVFEPINRANIKLLATQISIPGKKEVIETCCETVLGSLIRDRLITASNDLLVLTENGRAKLLNESMTKIRSEELGSYLSSLRVRYINVAYRFNTYEKVLR